jgi:hypothetical protein
MKRNTSTSTLGNTGTAALIAVFYASALVAMLSSSLLA